VRAFATVPATDMDCSVEVCHMRQRVVQAPVTSRRAVDERAAEMRHEAQSALLGIAAAASGLTRHRILTAQQIDELSNGLAAEASRLWVLFDEDTVQPATFDLYAAIAPVLTCARARGLDVRSSVQPGIEVAGSPDSTAQVLVALLANAERHAPGSPVDVRVSTSAGAVTLYVEDRGPGVPDALGERVFERSERAVGSHGSGLGLFIARRLMGEQNGTIWVEPRTGGGSSFVLCFDGRGEAPPAQRRHAEPALAPILVGA
jgi:two-component system, OmpR family, sensor kinase